MTTGNPASLSETWSKVEELLKRRDPEKEPYKSRYEALKLLRDARKALEGNEGETEAKARAALDHRIGLTKISVEERGEGEEVLLGCLDAMREREDDFVHQLQEAWNALGIVCFERDLTSRALEYLKLAEDVYQRRPEDASQNHFCLTLFYLAQAYSNLGEAELGAKYCALTLDSQLRAGTYATHDWAQNAVQLAGFYLDKARFATAHNLLEAAGEVLRRGAGHQEDSTPAGGSEGDVPANVSLGWAKLGLRVLVAAKEWKLGGGREEERGDHEEVEEEVQPELRFETLALRQSPHLGRSALFLDFEAARECFNEAMRRFNEALDHYKLDGWVTEHFQISMEVSALYKALAVFERDPHRICVMHRKRAKRIELISEDLNPKYFPSIHKSTLLELADVYREIMDVKARCGRPDGKVFRAGRESARRYRAFLEAIDGEEGGGGAESLEEDDLLYYIKARFELGRILHKLQGCSPEGAEARKGYLAESLGHLQWIEDFTGKHGEARAPPSIISRLLVLTISSLYLLFPFSLSPRQTWRGSSKRGRSASR